MTDAEVKEGLGEVEESRINGGHGREEIDKGQEEGVIYTNENSLEDEGRGWGGKDTNTRCK